MRTISIVAGLVALNWSALASVHADGLARVSLHAPGQADGSSAGSSPSPEASPAGKPFSIQQQDGTAWLVRPNGERFFSFGVCVVTMGASRKELDPDNPGYAAWQHYGDSNQWAEAALKRLKSWNFTTIGGWRDFSKFKQIPDMVGWLLSLVYLASHPLAPGWGLVVTRI